MLTCRCSGQMLLCFVLFVNMAHDKSDLYAAQAPFRPSGKSSWQWNIKECAYQHHPGFHPHNAVVVHVYMSKMTLDAAEKNLKTALCAG